MYLSGVGQIQSIKEQRWETFILLLQVNSPTKVGLNLSMCHLAV